MPIHIHIAYANDSDSHTAQSASAGIVSCSLLELIMPSAVQFQGEAGFGTEKIDNVITDYFLALKTNGVSS